MGCQRCAYQSGFYGCIVEQHFLHTGLTSAPDLANCIQLLIAQITVAIDPDAVGRAVGDKLKSPAEVIERAIAVDKRIDLRLSIGCVHGLGNFALLCT